MLSRGAMSLQESIERFILSPGWGKVRRSRIGGGERSEPIISMRIMPYDTESQSRNADFNKLAAKPPPQPSGQRPVKLKNPPANGRSILRTFLFITLLHNLRRQPRPFFIKSAAKPPPQPSGQRPVKLKNPPAVRPVNPKNLFLHNPSTQPAAVRRLQPSGRSPVNPHTEGVSNATTALFPLV